VETDGSPRARFAADVLRHHVVLMTGCALPEGGTLPILRFEEGPGAGYEIDTSGGGAVVRGQDPVRAAYDLLEAWGCRFDGPEPVVPTRETLAVAPRTWRPERILYVEGDAFDPSLPAQGIAVRGLDRYDPARVVQARELGYEVRVSSVTFDDFLPPSLFETHREWFARRGDERVPRGNFALLDAAARAAYAEGLGGWLTAHPEVDCVGIWPEVTSVWDEDALAQGAPESYALLWREVAARFPDRRFEILATGLTLRPPEGNVPGNVEVRLRPGDDASGLQGLASQPIEQVVRAWEARGARVVLEIDAQPDSFCGMPWPCHEAIRENARRFPAAVLRGGGPVHARLWRDPGPGVELPPLLARAVERARGVRSSGDPRDAADLFLEEDFGMAFRIGAQERLYRLAADENGDPEGRRAAAADLLFGYEAVRQDLPPADAATYRRHRGRDYEALFSGLLPEGAERRVGPALLRETFEAIEVETDRLRLSIDRRTARVMSLRRKVALDWSDDLAGGSGSCFAVVALDQRTDRVDGDVRITAADGGLRIELGGRLHAGGPRWRSVLELGSGSAIVHQTAEVEASGGIAVGCAWKGAVFDRWVCPPYAREGRLGAGTETPPAGYPLPPGTLLYCRDGEHGPGLALRVPDGGLVSLAQRDVTTLTAAHPAARKLRVDWIVFMEPGELGH